MNVVKRIYQRMITTEPVVYLDLFKAIVVFGTALGLFTIDDAKLATITTALGVLLTAGLTALNRNAVFSQQSVNGIKSAYKAQINRAGQVSPLSTNRTDNQ